MLLQTCYNTDMPKQQLKSFLQKAEEQKDLAQDQLPHTKALYMWNHHANMMKHHEQRIKTLKAKMDELHASDDDRVARLGTAEIETHNKEIERHRTERKKYDWALQ